MAGSPICPAAAGTSALTLTPITPPAPAPCVRANSTCMLQVGSTAPSLCLSVLTYLLTTYSAFFAEVPAAHANIPSLHVGHRLWNAGTPRKARYHHHPRHHPAISNSFPVIMVLIGMSLLLHQPPLTPLPCIGRCASPVAMEPQCDMNAAFACTFCFSPLVLGLLWSSEWNEARDRCLSARKRFEMERLRLMCGEGACTAPHRAPLA